MVTDEMIRVALLAFQSGDMDWSSQDEELMRFALEEALSAMPKPKPVTHLVWLQGRRAADDVEDYYEVARPGDKSVDGSDPFPVYMHPPAKSGNSADRAGWQLVPKEPTPEMLASGVASSSSLTTHSAQWAYRAMLAAAPAKQESGQ